MASTTWNRLRSLFRHGPTRVVTSAKSKPAIEIPGQLKPKPETISEAATVEPSNSNSVDGLVKRFKASSDSKRFRQGNFHYEATVRRLAARRAFSAIHDILEHQKRYPEISHEPFAVRLIVLYGRAKMFDEALKLFEELPSLNCDRTVLSFNALLGVCAKSRDFDKVSELFNELPTKLGFDPDVVSYNTVIKHLCDIGNFEAAISMIHEMEKNNVKPDAITFNTILDALYGMKKFLQAEKLWSLMEEKEVVRTVRSYNARLRSLVAENRNSEAVELIDEMRVKGVALNNYSYNAVTKGFVDDGNLEEAKRWYWNMINEHDLNPDKATFCMLLPLACDRNDFDFAFEMCKEAINTKQKVYESLVKRVIDGLIERSKNDEAEMLKELASTYVYRKLR